MAREGKVWDVQVHKSTSDRGYTWLDLGKLSRVERGGYKLERPKLSDGDIGFITSATREGMLVKFGQALDALDKKMAEVERSAS